VQNDSQATQYNQNVECSLAWRVTLHSICGS
jgi:hypothetical protein